MQGKKSGAGKNPPFISNKSIAVLKQAMLHFLEKKTTMKTTIPKWRLCSGVSPEGDNQNGKKRRFMVQPWCKVRSNLTLNHLVQESRWRWQWGWWGFWQKPSSYGYFWLILGYWAHSNGLDGIMVKFSMAAQAPGAEKRQRPNVTTIGESLPISAFQSGLNVEVDYQKDPLLLYELSIFSVESRTLPAALHA